MDYKKHYDLLIKRAQGRILEGYGEKHHIIPRCMAGSDDATNLVVLSAEEHYVAHQLLVKIHPENENLIYAARMMSLNANGNRPNNKTYGWLKRRFSEIHSKTMTGRIPWNKGVPQTAEAKRKQSESMKGKPGPNKGRTMSESTKEKLSKALTGRPGAMKGYKHSAKSRKNMSEGSKGQKAWNKGITGYTMPPASEERKKKISEGVKKNWIKRKERAKCLAG